MGNLNLQALLFSHCKLRNHPLSIKSAYWRIENVCQT